jgi:hypothetical protein
VKPKWGPVNLKIYNVSELEMQKTANCVKDVLLRTLEHEGLLTDTAEKIAGDYIVVIQNKGFFGQLFDKVRGVKDTDDNLLFRVVRII